MNNFTLKTISFMLLFIFLLNCIFLPLNIYAATNDNLTEKQQAIVNIANAYFSKGSGIQYDRKRRSTNKKPEEATDTWPIYLDCSSFVYNVYLQAFGIGLQKKSDPNDKLTTTSELANEAYKEFSKKSSYIPYIASNPSTKGKNKLLKELKSTLEVGDIIVFRRGKNIKNETSGHVLLYLGNGSLIHCTGNMYDYDNLVEQRESAAIQKTTLDNYVRSFSNNNVTRLAVIRPLESSYLNNKPLTDYAKIKNELPKLDIITTSSPGNLKTVNPGSNITYAIYLNNKSNKKINKIIINERISKYLTIDSNSIVTKLIKNGEETIITNTVTVNNNTLSSTINSLTPNTKIKIIFKAKVSTDESNLGKVINSQAQIGKIINGQKYFEGTNTIKLTIGKTLTKSQQNELVAVAREYEGDSYNGKIRNLINDIYSKALNMNTELGKTSVKRMLDTIMVTDKDEKITLNEDPNSANTKVMKTLLNNFYGYLYSNTDGAEYLTTKNLIPGDILIYSTNGKYYIRLYLSNNELLYIKNGKVIITNYKNNDLQKRLDKFIGYDKFAVLRPSLDM